MKKKRLFLLITASLFLCVVGGWAYLNHLRQLPDDLRSMETWERRITEYEEAKHGQESRSCGSKNDIYDTLVAGQKRLLFCDDSDSYGKKRWLDCIMLVGSVTFPSDPTTELSVYTVGRHCTQFCGPSYAVEICTRGAEPSISDVTSITVATSHQIGVQDSVEVGAIEPALQDARREWWRVVDGLKDSNWNLKMQVELFASMSRMTRSYEWPTRKARQVQPSDSTFIMERLKHSMQLTSSFYYIDSLELLLLDDIINNVDLQKYWILDDSTIVYYDQEASARFLSPVYLFPETVHKTIF